MAFVSHPLSVQDGWTPKPIFASKTKDTVDGLHISPTLHPPRHVFASVTLHIPPTNPCLHFAFFLPGNLASLLLDQSKPNPGTFLNKYSVPPCSRADRNVLRHLNASQMKLRPAFGFFLLRQTRDANDDAPSRKETSQML